MSNALRDFFAKYPTKRFEKDQVILFQDEKPPGIYMVKLGYVKAYDITPSGSERIMSYATRGNIFPLGYIFDESEDASKYFYAASSACEMYLVPKDDIVNFLLGNNQAAMEMCQNLSHSYYHVLERLNSVEQPKATEKILHTLKFLEQNYGRSGGEPTSHVEVPMKVQDLSSMVGLTRETVGAEIKKLKKAGVVTHRRWQFSINRQKLEEMIAHPLTYTKVRKNHREDTIDGNKIIKRPKE
jgi:CRP-like cAMP-binding protein